MGVKTLLPALTSTGWLRVSTRETLFQRVFNKESEVQAKEGSSLAHPSANLMLPATCWLLRSIGVGRINPWSPSLIPRYIFKEQTV